jgi:predicted nucleotidyltransferase
MYPVTDDQRTRIAELCRQFGVRRLDLVGSAVRGDFQASRSDVDLLVEFVDQEPTPGLDVYFGLKNGLEALFGRPVDLVMPEAVTNPYVRADFARDRTTLYAA